MMMTIHARMIKISSKPAAYSDVHTPDNLLICSLIDKYLIWVVLASFYNIGDCSGDNF